MGGAFATFLINGDDCSIKYRHFGKEECERTPQKTMCFVLYVPNFEFDLFVF